MYFCGLIFLFYCLFVWSYSFILLFICLVLYVYVIVYLFDIIFFILFRICEYTLMHVMKS